MGRTKFFQERVEARVVRLERDAERAEPCLDFVHALGLQPKDPLRAFGAPVDQFGLFENAEVMRNGGL